MMLQPTMSSSSPNSPPFQQQTTSAMTLERKDEKCLEESSFLLNNNTHNMHATPASTSRSVLCSELENSAFTEVDKNVGFKAVDGSPRKAVFWATLKSIKSPFRRFHIWFGEMKECFGAPFLALVIIVYGISQGYAGMVKGLATNYYWKDVEKLQPASTQVYQALASLPWSIKPIYGLITDTFPIAGYRRWPYLALCGVAGAIFYWLLAFVSGPPWMATLFLSGIALCAAFPDVVTDAAVAQQSRIVPAFSSDLQSLSWGSLAIGGLIGCGVSGIAVHSLGPRGSYFLISMAPLMLLAAASSLPENRLPKDKCKAQLGDLVRTLHLFGRTVREPRIWKPALYIYLSQGALCPNISEAMFFWLTDTEVGPGFSEHFLGLVNAVGYLAMFSGIAVYNCWLCRFTFRSMFFWAQVAACGIGFLDIILVTRTNLALKIPDHAFVLGDEVLSDTIDKLQLMPMLVLSAKLCPPGIEGTIFAFLMSVSNFGTTCGSWLGAILLRWLGVQKDDYTRLWLAVLIRSLMRLVPLAFLFLLPRGMADDQETPPQLVMVENGHLDDDDESKQMIDSRKGVELLNNIRAAEKYCK